MVTLRSDIERALDELISNEEGMRFQGLAVVLAKLRWPEFIACERKKDLGLDAYARATLAPDGRGKGLVCSITATYPKLAADAEKAQRSFPDVEILIFVTPGKVTNAAKQKWAGNMRERFGFELEVIPREEVISSLMEPANAALCQSHLGIPVVVEEPRATAIALIRQAAGEVIERWIQRAGKHPLIDLRAVRLDSQGKALSEVLHLTDLDAALNEGRRIMLEAPAGRGKTTTLIQLAGRQLETAGTAFLVDMPAWAASRVGILQFIASIPSFQARTIDASTLARASNVEPFSLLLNGWNEIAESDSARAVGALRELERDFPQAGIVVATRTHHIVPPLPGALRLRLLTLTRRERSAYLEARLRDKAGGLRSVLDGDPVLDELTRTPFILANVTAIFEAGEPIPATKYGVLEAVTRLFERSEEHGHHLQTTPLSGCAPSYLRDLAIETTGKGAVAISESDARRVCAAVGARLRESGQIVSLPEPAAVLGTLCAHHLLERVDHPAPTFQFEHQQFQEFYAALRIGYELQNLVASSSPNERDRFVSTYINRPEWAEPLRMVAEDISNRSLKESTARSAGRLLIEMALNVDLVFAAELAQACGTSVGDEIGGALAARLRSWYAVRDEHHRRCAVAAMVASGSAEFRDIIVALLSSEDQQIRLGTYRLWPDFRLSSLGPGWPQIVQAWGEEARVDFVSELLRTRASPEVSTFALADPSAKVKEAAVESLIWIDAQDEAARILSGTAENLFAHIIETLPPDRIPPQVRPRALEVLRRRLECRSDLASRASICQSARLIAA